MRPGDEATAMTDERTDMDSSGPEGKIEHVIADYDLDGLGAELEARWTGAAGEQHSLRALADQFNRRVLEAALTGAGVRSLDGEVENRYRLLTDEGVSAGMRQQTRRELERAGVDVEALESAFVSHQSIYTYLTDRRGAIHPSNVERDPEERIDNEIDKINALASRTSAVTTDSIERLAASDAIESDAASVFVDIRVTCEACGEVRSVESFLEAGGCPCQQN